TGLIPKEDDLSETDSTGGNLSGNEADLDPELTIHDIVSNNVNNLNAANNLENETEILQIEMSAGNDDLDDDDSDLDDNNNDNNNDSDNNDDKSDANDGSHSLAKHCEQGEDTSGKLMRCVSLLLLLLQRFILQFKLY
ncbi:hypothetical protein C0991_001898, partial [Blastosporella zonata]